MHGHEFYRPARDYTHSASSLPKSEVMIPRPPAVQAISAGIATWLQLLVPLFGIAGSLVFVLVYQNNPLILIALAGTALLSVGVGILIRFQQGQATKKRQVEEQKVYQDRLSGLRAELSKTVQLQRQMDAHLYPDPSTLLTIATHRDLEQPQIWERRPDDQDFLHVRLGVGVTPLCRPVRLELDPTIQYVPELRTQAEALLREYSYLDNAAIEIAIASLGTLSITGSSQATRALTRTILCQLATFHSPEDVRFVAYFPTQATQEWSWLKWLPHVRRLYQVRSEQSHAPEPLCLLADTIADFQELLSKQISRELERRRQLNQQKQDAVTKLMRPHLVLVLDGFTPDSELAQLADIKQLLQNTDSNGTDPAQHGVTVICLVNTIRQEPSAIQARVAISDSGRFTFQKIEEGGQRVEGDLADGADLQTCERIARSLAPLILADKGTQQDLSQDARLMDLLNTASVDALQIADTWRPRTGQDILRVPIGRRADGALLLLDLKETADKGMGPHGLVVGATGSGKSELLRTLVTSLAITHDPRVVNFVLVDFKGGATFANFAALPHVAGIITNLEDDPTLIDRVYASLSGEQKRRQNMLRDAGHLGNIKQYQALDNPALEPLPYLLIIIDEFAELIANRPDFLDLFVSIGRVGRSLGMHLLLATQRLEEGRLKGLETYLSYRICLRTFSASESTIVLGKPDAFFLPSAPGVGYFKVGTSIYSLFKTALISTPYQSSLDQRTPIALIREFTSTGQLASLMSAMAASLPTWRLTHTADGKARTEMEVAIERLAEEARLAGNHRPAHQVWLPPLAEALMLDTILTMCQRSDLDGSAWPTLPPFGPLNIPIGLLDKPLEQVQEPLMLDFSGSGGHLALVGSPRSGKSTLLATLIASLIVTHSPQQVQIYGIDVGGGLIGTFDGVPHVGTICTRLEGDKIRRMIQQVRKIIEERMALFREQHIDSMATYRLRRQAGELTTYPYGDVFLLIDNLAQLFNDFEHLKNELIEIVALGLNYGIHVIISANRWAEVPPKLRDNIGTLLELHLNTATESEFGKVVAASLPDIAGRGLTRDKLQFQAALPYVGGVYDLRGTQLQQSIEALVQRTKLSWKQSPAPPIRLLPSLLQWQNLPQPSANQPSGVPIGVDEFQLKPVYIDLLSAGPHFLIFGDAECGKTNLFRIWMRGLQQRYTAQQVQLVIIDPRRKLADFSGGQHLFAYGHTTATAKESIERLKAELDKRVQPSNKEDAASTQKWSGPHYFLFVDDYHIFASQPTNPLTPLNDALLQARDTGLHLILARTASGAASSFDPIIKRLKEVDNPPGLVMSGNPQDGQILGTQKASSLPPGRAYLVRRRQSTIQIQIAFADPKIS